MGEWGGYAIQEGNDVFAVCQGRVGYRGLLLGVCGVLFFPNENMTGTVQEIVGKKIQCICKSFLPLLFPPPPVFTPYHVG